MHCSFTMWPRTTSQSHASPSLLASSYSREVCIFPVFQAPLTFVPSALETWPHSFPSFLHSYFITYLKCCLFENSSRDPPSFSVPMKVLSPSYLGPDTLLHICHYRHPIRFGYHPISVWVFLLSALVHCGLLEAHSSCVCFISVS